MTGHGHHEHTPDVDFGERVDEMQRGADLWSTVTARIAAELPMAGGAVVADVGCGTGDMTLLLARRAAASGGRVLAVDRERSLLTRVRERADAAALGDTVRTVCAAMRDLPGALPSKVGLLWAGHSVHHAGDQAAAIAGLVEALEPGGVLAIGEGGVPPKCLPWDLGVGRPGLEIRLTAAIDGWFGSMRASLPDAVRDPRGWSAMLRAAGLSEVTERGYLLHAPELDVATKATVLHRLEHSVERAGRWLDEDDRAAWRRLLDRDDEAWLGHRDDLNLIAVDTVHLGRLA